MLKLAVLSDLHLDINSSETRGVGRDILPDVARYLSSLDVHHIVIAGDVAETAEKSLTCLDYLSKHSATPISFIPGNHDVWTDGTDVREEYEKCSQSIYSLIERPLRLSDTCVILGDMGWYDYSLGPHPSEVENFENTIAEHWDFQSYLQHDPVEFTNMMLSRLELQLEAHRHQRVIVVTHFVPYPDFIVVKENEPHWNFTNAFMGSRRMGDLINKYDNVEYVVFGHTHTRFGTRQTQGRTVVCNPLGYVHEWSTPHVTEQLELTTTLISI